MKRTVNRSRPVQVDAPPQTNDEINIKLIRLARKSGSLNLIDRNLTEIPKIVCDIDKMTGGGEMSVDLSFNRSAGDEWWNERPLQRLLLGSNKLKTLRPEISQLEHLSVLDVRNNEIECLPPEMDCLSKLTELNLSGNKLKNIPECICDLKDLKVLNLEKNGIVEVTDKISGLLNLVHLNLNNNKLSHLPDALTFLSSLKILDLSQNSLLKLPPDVNSMTHLTVLNVSNNRLSEIPEAIGRCMHLEELISHHNKLTSIPVFARGNNLTQLIMSYNAITEFTEQHCEVLLRLEILDLQSNSLEKLPEEMVNIQSLKRLNVADNRLRSLPSSLGSLNHLIDMRVGGNHLERTIRKDILDRGAAGIRSYLRSCGENAGTSPESLNNPIDLVSTIDQFSLGSSRCLDLSNRRLTQLDSQVVEIAIKHKVTKLVLNKNGFTDLPSTLDNLLPQLTELDLSFNSLKSLPSRLSIADHLQYINVMGNQITDLPDELAVLSNIRELDICRNKLSKIPECVYSWRKLESLSCSSNSIDELDVSKLAALTMLSSIDVSNNSLKRIPPELGDLTNIRNLRLEGNLIRYPGPDVQSKGTLHIMAWLRDRIPKK